MKKITILMALLSISMLSSAQIIKASYVNTYAGISMPIGTFKAISFSGLNNPGFAKTGWNVGIESMSFGNKAWGAALFARLHGNKFDEDAYARALVANNPAIQTAKVKTGSYMGINFGIGAVYKLELGNKIDLLGKGLIGINLLSPPNKFQISKNGGPINTINLNEYTNNYSAEDDSEAGFSLNLGLSFIYKLNERTGISLNIDHVRDSGNSDYFLNKTADVERLYEHKTRLVNFSIGLVRTLFNKIPDDRLD